MKALLALLDGLDGGLLLVLGLLALVLVVVHEIRTERECRRRGHVWRSEWHPFTQLLTPKCRRCRRWAA